MSEAIRLSIENVQSGRGGPFAALVVKGGTIIARGTNLVTGGVENNHSHGTCYWENKPFTPEERIREKTT